MIKKKKKKLVARKINKNLKHDALLLPARHFIDTWLTQMLTSILRVYYCSMFLSYSIKSINADAQYVK